MAALSFLISPGQTSSSREKRVGFIFCSPDEILLLRCSNCRKKSTAILSSKQLSSSSSPLPPSLSYSSCLKSLVSSSTRREWEKTAVPDDVVDEHHSISPVIGMERIGNRK
jgi:hypothetical protein